MYPRMVRDLDEILFARTDADYGSQVRAVRAAIARQGAASAH